MEKNKKLNKTKDSLLIGKNSRFSEEINETARKRTIIIGLLEIILLITYIVLIIIYLVGNRISKMFLMSSLVLLCIQCIVEGFTIHSLVFFKDYIITKSSNLSVAIYFPLIASLILMYLEERQFNIRTIPQIVLIVMLIAICIMEQYLIRRFVIDYLRTKQRYNIKTALYNRKSFEEHLSKSVASKSGDEFA